MVQTSNVIEWFNPRMTGKELYRLQEVLSSNFINDGPLTKEFEAAIAKLTDRNFAIAVPSGTVALTLALMAHEVASADVVVPDFTFIATANAVRLAGGNVVFADVDRKTLCITAATVEAVRTRRTRFVISVEVNGRSPNYAELNAYCRTNGLVLITDSCEALGADLDGKPLGKFGKASCFSFSPNKLVTTGQGGMVVTDDPDVNTRIRQLKNQGIFERGTGGNDLHSTLGFNFKFTDLQAAVGLAQLEALPERVARCQQRDQWYRAALDGLDIEFPGTEQNKTHLWFDILVPHHYALAMHLRSHGIGIREFWFPIHKQKPYLFNKLFPVSTEVSNRGLWLPSSYDITEDQVGQVAACIRKGFV